MSFALPRYAELHCLSNFTFLRGASHPEELVERAAALGYDALALTDECSFAGVVRAHLAAKRVRPAADRRHRSAARRRHEAGAACARSRGHTARSAALITLGRRRAKKGRYALAADDVETLAGGHALALWVPGGHADPAQARWLGRALPRPAPGSRSELHCGPHDRAWLARLRELARAADLPLVAAGDVHMHLRSQRPAAGHADRDPAGQAGRALRPRAVPERRAPPAPAHAARAALSARAARRDSRHRRALPFLARCAALRVSRGAGAAGRDAGELGCAGWLRTACAARSRTASPTGVARARRARARADRRARLRALLPHRARHRALRARARHSVPGPRLGGQFGGVLRARHHRGRPDAHEHAVRALRIARSATSRPTSTSISSTSGARR